MGLILWKNDKFSKNGLFLNNLVVFGLYYVYYICILIDNMIIFDQLDIKVVYYFNLNYFGDFDGF